MVNKQTTTSNIKTLDMKRIMTYDIGNPDPCFEKVQKCGRIKSVNGIPTLPSDNLVLEMP